MILIIGASGILGKQLCHLLATHGFLVRAASRNIQRHEHDFPKNIELVKCDLTNPSTIHRVLENVDTVISCAHSLTGRGRYSFENVDGRVQRKLIDLARQKGIRHFIYLSAKGASADASLPFFRTKYETEEHLRSSGLRYTVVRPTAFMEMHIHKLLGEDILKKNKAIVIGHGTRPVNYVAANDVARVILNILQTADAENETIEIYGPDNISRRAIISLYASKTGSKVKVTSIPVWLISTLSKIIRPFHSGIASVMEMIIVFDEKLANTDMQPMPYNVTPTSVEMFIAEDVKHSGA